MNDDRTCSRPKCGNVRKPGGNKTGLCEQHYTQLERSPYRPVEPVIARINLLRERGYGYREIGEATGLTFQGLRWILLGKSKRVQRRTFDAIMSVPVPTGIASIGGNVPAIGTQRRIHALMVLGWTQQDIARASGIPWRTVSNLMRQDRVLARTAGSIASAFNQMQWKQPPDSNPARRCRSIAKRAGWEPPLAWDEDTIDNPNATPFGLESEEPQPFLDKYAEMRGLGLSDIEVAKRTGASYMAIVKRLERGQLPVSTELRALTRTRAS